MQTADLKSETQALLSWLTDAALPFWAKNAVDAEGGWYEHLDLSGAPNTDVIRRLRVQARQIYVYGLAGKMGWYSGKDTVQNTFDFMTAYGFEKGGQPGFIHLLTPDYQVHDPRRDLYDHAFYLFACAWMKNGTGDVRADEIQSKIISLMDTLKSPHGGWSEGIPRKMPRRQNPHMHLFEAMMTWYDISGDEIWMKRAADIFTLFERHFFDPKYHIIREFFGSDWKISPGELGRTSEPGHLAEWIWLLWMYEARSGVDTSGYAAALYGNLLSKPGPFLNDEEDVFGNPRRETKRLWVQTEVIKAHLAQANRGAAGAASHAAHVIAAFREIYLRPDGTWMDQIDETGAPVASTIPVSTFYHIICMIYEAVTCKGR